MEVGQQGGQVDDADRRQGAHGDGAADGPAGGVDGVFGRAGGVEGCAGAWPQLLSRGGQRHPRRASDKQLRAEFALEGLDRRGHPGLDDMQPHGGLGKAPRVGDSKKVLQVAKLHPAIITDCAGPYQKVSLAVIALPA